MSVCLIEATALAQQQSQAKSVLQVSAQISRSKMDTDARPLASPQRGTTVTPAGRGVEEMVGREMTGPAVNQTAPAVPPDRAGSETGAAAGRDTKASIRRTESTRAEGGEAQTLPDQIEPEQLGFPTEQGAREPAPAVPVACNIANFRIAIDVGHTETNHGVISARNKPEFAFNLRLANELLAKLQKAGFRQAAVVVQPDSANLFRRARELSGRRPDMMISLHHDSVQDRFLQKGNLEGQVRTFTRYARGYSIFVSRDNSQLEESKQFALELGHQLRNVGLKPTMHHNEKIAGENRPIFDPIAGVFYYDKLVVLRLTSAPAVLLESAVITEPDDELRAEDPAYRARITDSIVVALGRYCILYPPQSHDRAASDGPKKKPSKR